MSRKLRATDLRGTRAVEWAKGRLVYLKTRAVKEGMTDEIRHQTDQARTLLRREGGPK